MGRRTGVALACCAVGLVLAPATASAARGPQVANVVMALEYKLSSERLLTYRPKPNCDGSKGTVESLATADTRTVVRTKLVRARYGGRITYELRPWRSSLNTPYPISMRYQDTSTQALQNFVLGDEEPPTCRQLAAPGNGTKTDNCRFKTNFLFRWDDKPGRHLAAFRQVQSRCDPSGYPGLTEYLRPRDKTSAKAMYRRKRNVLTGKSEKRRNLVEDDGATGTEVDKAEWKMTLVRTSRWRPFSN